MAAESDRTWRRRWWRTDEAVAGLTFVAVLAALAICVLEHVGGELMFALPLCAGLGVVSLLRPAALVSLDAPRRWFAGGHRPPVSKGYRISGRIGGVALLFIAFVAPFLGGPGPH